MPIEAKRKTRAGGGGKLDVGAILGYSMPDQGAEITTDEAGKPTAKSNNKGLRKALQGDGGANSFNQNVALSAFTNQLGLAGQKEMLGASSRQRLEDQPKIDALAETQQRKINALDVEKEKQLLEAKKLQQIDTDAIQHFGLPYSHLTPEQQQLMVDRNTAMLKSAGQQYNTLTAQNLNTQMGADAQRPGVAENAISVQLENTAANRVKTKRDEQSLDMITRDPSITANSLTKPGLIEGSPGSTLFNNYNGQYRIFPGREEVPGPMEDVSFGKGAPIMRPGKPVAKQGTNIISGQLSQSTLAVQAMIEEQHRKEAIQAQQRRDAVTP